MEALPYVAMGDSAGVGVGSRDGRGYVDRVYDRLEAVAPRARLVDESRERAARHTVYLLGMEEELFPYVRKSDGKEEMDEEEERRLAYVALTRARKDLTLLHVAQRTLFGNTRFAGPSRFLLDLPPEIIERSGVVSRPAPPPAASYGGYGGYGGGQRGGGSWGGGGQRSGGGSWGGGSRFPPRPAAPKPEPVPRAPGERYVERDVEVTNNDGDELHVRKGSRVKHGRFGEGSVVSVDGGLDPAVTVSFPAWGLKKVLVRFLQPL